MIYQSERSVRIKGVGWLPQLYRAYYSLKPPIEEPTSIERREFAFQLFDSETYIRHISFMSIEELSSFLKEKYPKQSYYSIALYEVPDARSMEEKMWIGSELMFDIDPAPGVDCTIIEGIPGDDCIMWAYMVASRIRDIIERDLGLKATIYFTGHKGFHVKAWGEEVARLGRDARRLIAFYVSGRGVSLEKLFPKHRKGVAPATPGPNDPGWRGWIARILGLEPGKNLIEVLGPDWMHVLMEKLNEWRPRIDYQVTQDPTRLSRIRGSLNGKAGLLVVDATYGFTPDYRKLAPFRGEVDIVPKTNISGFKLFGFELELKPDRRSTVPAWLAVVLESKKLLKSAWGEIIVRRPREVP